MIMLNMAMDLDFIFDFWFGLDWIGLVGCQISVWMKKKHKVRFC